MFDFQASMQSFLDALYGFINDLLNQIFGSLAEFFNGLSIF